MLAMANKGGAPKGSGSKKSPQLVAKVLDLVKQGKTRDQICEIVGVAPRTLRYWKSEDWEFAASLKENEQLANQLVEASLFKKATGFEHTYTTEVATKDGGVVTIEQTDYIPPSDTAAIFYLKNRVNDRWKDQREDIHKLLMVKQELIGTLTPQELIDETERLLKKLKEERDKKIIDVKPG